jgi:hypothetical protein
MGHGPYSSFEARKPAAQLRRRAHLPSERKCVRPGMTETVQVDYSNLNPALAIVSAE